MSPGEEPQIPSCNSGAAMCAVSLFSGGGLGDFALESGLAIPVVASCELLPERAAMLRQNTTQGRVFEGDIHAQSASLVDYVHTRLKGRRPWIVVLSPPCQGMSTNGMGRMNRSKSRGKRPRYDSRNRLLLPGLDVVCQLHPDVILFENVPAMAHAVIEMDGKPQALMDILAQRLHPEYVIHAEVMQVANYGVPQRRARLITICVRASVYPRHLPAHPPESSVGSAVKYRGSLLHAPPQATPPITVHTALGGLPPLDARHLLADAQDPLHRVPKWSEWQHHCMMHTPEGRTAFDNMTCTACGAVSVRRESVQCEACREALPRPRVATTTWRCSKCKESYCMATDCCDVPAVSTKSYRLVRAFKTSYKRMESTRVASALTTNSGVISSDVKGHPTEHRVMSLREILILSSVQLCNANRGDVVWQKEFNVSCPDKVLRAIVGEGIPPLFLYKIVRHVHELLSHGIKAGQPCIPRVADANSHV